MLLNAKNMFIFYRHYAILSGFTNERCRKGLNTVVPVRKFTLSRIVSVISQPRFIAIVGAIGVYYYINKKYKELKGWFPDMEQMRSVIPGTDKVHHVIYSKMTDFSTFNKNIVLQIYNGARNQLGVIIDRSSSSFKRGQSASSQVYSSARNQFVYLYGWMTRNNKEQMTSPKVDGSSDKMVKMCDYNEKERLQDEVKELRKQLIIKKEQFVDHQMYKKKSLIELYKDILGEMSVSDANFIVQDNLPQIVVIGEGNIEKTFLLEIIADINLIEALFIDAKLDTEDGPEFDLSNKERFTSRIEEMKTPVNQFEESESIIKQPVLFTLTGQSIDGLVLVDLQSMYVTEADSKIDVETLTKQYLNKSNAIILLIQDTDKHGDCNRIRNLLSSVDPKVERTIFVLTKVDKLSNQREINGIVSGKGTAMEAVENFDVLLGKDSITTQFKEEKLSKVVSDKYWKMVRRLVEHHVSSTKAFRLKLENEWRFKYIDERQFDRIELFERAKSEILDSLIKLSSLSPESWNHKIISALWNKIKNDIFEEIYIASHESSKLIGHYLKTTETKLKLWSENNLTTTSIAIGWKVLEDTLAQIDNDKSKRYSTEAELYRNVQKEVLKRCFNVKKWDPNAESRLRVIQSDALKDIKIDTQVEWDSAVMFLLSAVEDQMSQINNNKDTLKGPGYVKSWLKWQGKSLVEMKRCAVFDELRKVFENEPTHQMTLSMEEVNLIKQTLEINKVEVDSDFIREVWLVSYKEALFKKARSKAQDCLKGFHHYHHGYTDKSDLDCRDVLFFRRIQRMLQNSSDEIRDRIMNNEIRQLKRTARSVLEEIWADNQHLKTLLVDHRVQMADDLKHVRQIEDMLEDFIKKLSGE